MILYVHFWDLLRHKQETFPYTYRASYYLDIAVQRGVVMDNVERPPAAFCTGLLSFTLGRLSARTPFVFFLCLSSAAFATIILASCARFLSFTPPYFLVGVLHPIASLALIILRICCRHGFSTAGNRRLRFTASSCLSATTGCPLTLSPILTHSLPTLLSCSASPSHCSCVAPLYGAVHCSPPLPSPLPPKWCRSVVGCSVGPSIAAPLFASRLLRPLKFVAVRLCLPSLHLPCRRTCHPRVPCSCLVFPRLSCCCAYHLGFLLPYFLLRLQSSQKS